MIKRNILIFSAIVVFAVLSYGCATLSAPAGKKASLKDRVNQLMNARITGNWDVVYDISDSAFRKKVHRKEFASRPRKLQFKSFEIRKIEILPSGSEATVDVRNEISMGGYVFKNAPEIQNWVKVDDTWYLKIKAPKNPFKKN